MPMNVIIAGSREFNDYTMLENISYGILMANNAIKDEITILTGGARGADTLGEKFAKEYGYKSVVIEADWDKWGKRAGYLRNLDMADWGDCADLLIVFWDGKSKGARHMIEIAKNRDIDMLVYRYN